MNTRPLVITGPSGVGKGTLIAKLEKKYPKQFSFSVSHTTRGPRKNERDGIDYHFCEKEKMKKEIEDGEFIEWANVHGNLYGTSFKAVKDASASGSVPILDIDVQGARSVLAKPEMNALFVFIKPPSVDELKKRLLTRSTESDEAIAERVKNAVSEIEASSEPFWNKVLVNDNLEDCFNALCEFVETELNVQPAPVNAEGQ